MPSPVSFETDRVQANQHDEEARLIALATRTDSQGKPTLLGCLRAMEDMEYVVGHHTTANINLLIALKAFLQRNGLRLDPVVETLLDEAQNHMEVLADHVDSTVAGEGAWTTTGRELYYEQKWQAAQA